MADDPIFEHLLDTRRGSSGVVAGWRTWYERMHVPGDDLRALAGVTGRGEPERSARRAQAENVCVAAAWLLALGTVQFNQGLLPSRASRNFRTLNLSFGDLEPFLEFLGGTLANQYDAQGSTSPPDMYGLGRNTLTGLWEHQRLFQQDLMLYLLRPDPYLTVVRRWKANNSLRKIEMTASFDAYVDYLVMELAWYQEAARRDPVMSLVRMIVTSQPSNPVLRADIAQIQQLEVGELALELKILWERYGKNVSRDANYRATRNIWALLQGYLIQPSLASSELSDVMVTDLVATSDLQDGLRSIIERVSADDSDSRE